MASASYEFDWRSVEAMQANRRLHGIIYPRWLTVALFASYAAPVILIAVGGNWILDLLWRRMQLPAFTDFLPLVAIAAYVFAFVRWIYPATSRWSLKFARTAGGEGRTTAFEFDDDGLTVRSAGIATRANWDAIDAIAVRDGMVFLQFGLMAWYLPKRAFASASARSDFVQWALGRLTPEARQRSRV